MVKKALLLFVIVGVLAALVASLAQGEANRRWKDAGTNISSNAAIELTGSMSFSAAVLGGFECPVLAKLTLTSGTSTADVTDFKIETTSACKFSGLIGIECESVTSHLAAGLPWSGTGTGSGAIDLSGVSFQVSLAAKPGHTRCPSKLTLESNGSASPTLTLDSTTAATKAVASGTMNATDPSGTFPPFTAAGTLNVLSPNSGTYGIG